MDGFFRKRVGGLRQQIEAGVSEPTVDGMTPQEQWRSILETAGPLLVLQAQTYQEIRCRLATAGVWRRSGVVARIEMFQEQCSNLAGILVWHPVRRARESLQASIRAVLDTFLGHP